MTDPMVKIPRDKEWSWPFMWYEHEIHTIFIKHTKDWFEPEGINHEYMHHVLYELEGITACMGLDRIRLEPVGVVK